MKKFIFSIVIFAFISVITGSKILACSCAPSADNIPFEEKVKEAVDISTAVFSGEVSEVKKEPGTFFVKVKFKVKTAWKNKFVKEITITTGLNDGLCGYNFEVGEEYLIYAYGKQNNLGTGICTRTSLLKSNKDITVLNKLAKRKSKPAPK
jgi:hypothetical protein